MKKWIEKLIEQFDFDWSDKHPQGANPASLISDDRATLIYIIDTYNKNLMEIEKHPVRKVRETLDEFAKELLDPDAKNIEKTLFRLRQFFSTYRLDEYASIQKSAEDFRGIIWDFVDQLSEDLEDEQLEDDEIKTSLDELKEAVESNSVETLKAQSRQFIDNYVEYQVKRDRRKTQKLDSVRSNLHVVKKKLIQANHSLRRDHLTHAYNRKSFDEQLAQYWKYFQASKTPVSLLSLDIDHFKMINDNYGHAIGDFVLVECVKLLQEVFSGEAEFVARVGGEEFCVILPDSDVEQAVAKANLVLERTRKEVFVNEGMELRFTVSLGVAELGKGENIDEWMKRADDSLYHSKKSGRDQYTVAKPKTATIKVA